MEISPCLAGSSVCAAAAAIGALPSPASLEKIPLAIPFCMATIIAPSAPPAAALTPNALLTIVAKAPGTLVILNPIISTASITYVIAIKGTITCATEEILLIPPIITSATKNVTAIAAMTTVHE